MQSSLATLSASRADYADARRRFQTALTIQLRLGNSAGQASILNNLGIVHREEGQLTEAGECYAQALRLYREVGNRHAEWSCLGNLGVVELELGQVHDAVRAQQSALEGYTSLGVADQPLNDIAQRSAQPRRRCARARPAQPGGAAPHPGRGAASTGGQPLRGRDRSRPARRRVRRPRVPRQGAGPRPGVSEHRPRGRSTPGRGGGPRHTRHRHARPARPWWCVPVPGAGRTRNCAGREIGATAEALEKAWTRTSAWCGSVANRPQEAARYWMGEQLALAAQHHLLARQARALLGDAEPEPLLRPAC